MQVELVGTWKGTETPWTCRISTLLLRAGSRSIAIVFAGISQIFGRSLPLLFTSHSTSPSGLALSIFQSDP
ncbi:hypothetical protein BGW80DRAFT_505168 [Lactifluus volemus]|nr:hypothetical protein BGW80DRAFT_505168 [Lactifluus volemus]